MKTNYTKLRDKLNEILPTLGTPVTIADILRALNIRKITMYAIDSQGDLWERGSGYKIKVNLILPLSHEWNDEACGQILQLIES